MAIRVESSVRLPDARVQTKNEQVTEQVRGRNNISEWESTSCLLEFRGTKQSRLDSTC